MDKKLIKGLIDMDMEEFGDLIGDLVFISMLYGSETTRQEMDEWIIQ